ncbi:MAG TPA: phage tail tape measure protein [Candidatus Scatomorpha merdigallinarum]|nr:phage tail tape measure protein [Candidatus Scatomorpha merdigallinarum]
MPSRKEYEMLFQLNAELGKSFNSTFNKAQQELLEMQKEIQSLSKTQSDISAYQKQQTAVNNTANKLSLLQQQYVNIQKEISETKEFSSSLENQLLSKQKQIERTEQSLEKYKNQLNETGKALEDAGVDTSQLESESARLAAEIDDVKQQQYEAAEAAKDFGNKGTNAFQAVQQAIAAAGITTALKEIYEYFADCAEASMDFESAMTGVAKTTDLTNEELSDMSSAIRGMSTEMPSTAEEIAAVTEAAGQLGIQKDALLDFTEVMTMLGTATNMSADEAATALARFANITGMSADNYDRLGAVIVGLGNNYATTESEITAMATRLASAGKLAGLTEPEILALSAAMSSVGIEAEAGGTAMTQTLSAIESAVAHGGDTLNEFARIAGMSAADFADMWETNAIGALTSFIGGLGQLEAQGESAVLTLDELGMSGVRQSNMLQSLALAADQMTGAVNLANQEWTSNTALINEASKRYETTESQLQMMQNAYHNLQAAIGDAYTPALREAYGVITDALNGLTEFVEEHPEAVAAVTAFAGVVGTVVAALTAYSVVAKVAKTATALLTASIPGLNVIMGVTAAVGALAGVVAAVASAAKNDAVPSVKELTEATEGMQEAMDEAQATFEDTASSTMAAANIADQYITKLEEMEAAGVRTDAEHRQYHNTLTLLCQVVPELANYIDLETDTIEGGTAALRANTEAWRENAMQQAYQEQLNTLYSQYSAVLIEAEENSLGYTKAQYALEAAEQKKADAIERMNELWQAASEEARRVAQETGGVADASFYLTQEYYELEQAIADADKEINTSRDTMDAYQKAMDKDAEAVAAAEAEISSAEEAVASLTGALDANTSAMTEDSQQLQSALSSVNEQVQSLAESYAEAYDAAAESIGGQYQLWDQAAAVTATSAATINSALASQTEYWQNYNANLQALTERSSGIAGLSEMIASFADGSAESVNAIAGMASASDEDLRAMVENWQALQEAQQEAAGGVADLTTGFTTAMDELQTELAADIEAMDLSTEAQESGKATIQGFITGASSMLPDVQAAYARLASAAVAALGSGGTGGVGTDDVPHYASGTQSAAPGFAVVGEDGPEVVYMRGGERVLNAQQTAALQAQSAVPAALPGDTGGFIIYFSPEYQLAGASNIADIQAMLAEHDEGLMSQLEALITRLEAERARRSYA